MAYQVVAEGKVTLDNGVYFLSVPDDPEQPRTTMWRGWRLGKWAKPYWGQWLAISLKEEEEQKGGTMEELEKRILELERRVEKITTLQTHPAHGLQYDPFDHHLGQHKVLREQSHRMDKSLGALQERVAELQKQVAKIRYAVLRLASDESVHDLLK